MTPPLPHSDLIEPPDQIIDIGNSHNGSQGSYILRWVSNPAQYISQLPLVGSKLNQQFQAQKIRPDGGWHVRDIVQVLYRWLAQTYGSRLISFVQEPTALGQTKYIYTFNQSWSDIADLVNLVDAIAYPRLRIDIQANKLNRLSGFLSPTETLGQAKVLDSKAWDGLLGIMKAVAGSMLQTEVTKVLTEDIILPETDSLVTRCYFQTKDGELIGASPGVQARLDIEYNFHLYYGWRFFSNNPLALHALEQTIHNDSQPIKYEEDGLKPDRQPADPELNIPVKILTVGQYNNYLIPIQDQFDDAYQSLDLLLKSYNNRYYQAWPLQNDISQEILAQDTMLTSLDSDRRVRLALYSELLQKFNYTILKPNHWLLPGGQSLVENVYRFDPSPAVRRIMQDDDSTIISIPVIIQAPEPDEKTGLHPLRGASFTSWLKESMTRIIQNQLPLFNFRGSWNSGLTGSQSENRARVHLLAHLAYRRLIKDNPYLRSSLLEVQVQSDYTIQVPVADWSQVLEYQTELERLYSSLSLSTLAQWEVLYASSTEQMAQFRWYIQQHEPRAQSLALKHKDDWWLVVDQDLGLDGTDLRSGQTKAQFLAALSRYFNLSEVQDFDYYLQNVPVIDLGPSPIEAKNRTVQLVNREALLRSTVGLGPDRQLNIFLNPKTGNMIDSESLSRISTYSDGWAGLYSIGWPTLRPCQGLIEPQKIKNPTMEFLSGLYSQPPTRYFYPLDGLAYPGEVQVRAQLSPETAQAQAQAQAQGPGAEWLAQIEVHFDPGQYSCPYNQLSSTHISVGDQTQMVLNLMTLALPRSEDTPKWYKSHKKSKQTISALNSDELKSAEEIESVVQTLWQAGWFLSQWSTSLLYSKEKEKDKDLKDKISCTELNQHYPLNQILRNAEADGRYGQLSLQYLNTMVNWVLTSSCE